MGLLGPVVGRAFDRFGPRPLVIPAAAIVLAAMGLLAMLDEGTSKGADTEGTPAEYATESV